LLRRLGGSESGSGHSGKDKKVPSLPEIEF